VETLTTASLIIISAAFSIFLIYKGVAGVRKTLRMDKK